MTDSKFDPMPPDKSTVGTEGSNNGLGTLAADAGAPEDIDLLAVIKRAKQIGQDFQKHSVERPLHRAYRAWRNEHAEGSKYLGTAWRGRSRLFVPKTRAAVRKNLAGAAASLFATDDVVNIQATWEDDPIQKATAATLKADFDYRLTQSSSIHGIPWFLICMGGCLDGQITGVTISKQYWQLEEVPTAEVEEYETQLTDEEGQPVIDMAGNPVFVVEQRPVMRIARDRPMCELHPIENSILDPAAPWFNPVQHGRWFSMLFPMSLSDAKAMLKGGPSKGWLDVPDELLLKGRFDEENAGVRRAREGGRDRYEESKTPGELDIVVLQENFVRIAGIDWHFWSVGTDAFISEVRPVEEAYPEMGGERPYVMGVAQIDTHRVFPMSPVESWQPLQLELNDVTNLRLDTLKRAIAPLAKVRKGKGVDLMAVQRRGQPDSVLLLDDPDKDVILEPTPGPNGASYTETSVTNASFDELAGVFSTSSVQTSRQLNETVGGMRLMSGAANSVSEFDLRIWVETWVEPVLRQMLHLLKYHEHDQNLVLMSGRQSRVLQQFGYMPSVLDFDTADVTLKVNVGIGAADPMQRIAKLKMALEMLAPLFPIMREQGIEPNLEELIDEVMGSAGFKDGRRFFKFGDPSQQKQGEDPELQKLMLEMQLERERMKNDLMQVVMTLRSEETRNTQDNATKIQLETMKGQREVAKQVVGVASQREAREHDVMARREDFENQRTMRQDEASDNRRQDAIRLFAEKLASYGGGKQAPQPQQIQGPEPQALQPVQGPDPGMSMMSRMVDRLEAMQQRDAALMGLLRDIQTQITAPAEIIRDASGRALGVRKGGQVQQLVRNQDGFIAGAMPARPPAAAQLPL